MRVNHTDVVVQENVHIVRKDVIDQDVHLAKEVHLKNAGTANDRAKEVDVTMKVVVHTVMDDPGAVIVTSLAQVELEIVAMITTTKGKKTLKSITFLVHTYNYQIISIDQIVQETNLLNQVIQVNHLKEGISRTYIKTNQSSSDSVI